MPTEKPTRKRFLFTRAFPEGPHRSTQVLSPCFFSLAPTATAVPWLVPGCIADVSPPLRGVWESLRRVLLGPGPVLRLGRHRMLEILPHRQEVGGTHARALNASRQPLFVSQRRVSRARTTLLSNIRPFVLRPSHAVTPGSYQSTCSGLLQLALKTFAQGQFQQTTWCCNLRPPLAY